MSISVSSFNPRRVFAPIRSYRGEHIDWLHNETNRLLFLEYLEDYNLFFVRRGLPSQISVPTKFSEIRETRIEIMARKKKTTAKGEGIGEWKGFANITFGKEDKAEMLVWTETADVWTMLQELVASDYKVSFNADQRHDAFVCSMSCYDPESPNFKRTMTSRAPSVPMACAVGLYKHFVIADQDWDVDEESEAWG